MTTHRQPVMHELPRQRADKLVLVQLSARVFQVVELNGSNTHRRPSSDNDAPRFYRALTGTVVCRGKYDECLAYVEQHSDPVPDPRGESR